MALMLIWLANVVGMSSLAFEDWFRPFSAEPFAHCTPICARRVKAARVRRSVVCQGCNRVCQDERRCRSVEKE